MQPKNYLWNSIGSFLQSAISPALLLVITRLHGLTDSGVFSFALSLSVVFWAIGLWGGRTYQVSDVRHEFSHSSYIAVKLATSLIMLVGATLFCLVNGYDMFKTSLIMTLVLFKAFEAIADALYGVLQLHDKLYLVGYSLTIKALAGFVGFVVVDLLTHNILLGVLAVTSINGLVVLLYDWPRARRYEPIRLCLRSGFVVKKLRQIACIMQRCAPVFLTMFLTMFSLNIPRYFLDRYQFSQELALFGIMAMPITLLSLFISFIIQPNIVQLSRLYHKRQFTAFHNLVNMIILVVLIVSVVTLLATWLVGAPLLALLFNNQILHYRTELLIMVVGAVASAVVSIYINILTVLRRFRGQFITLFVSNVVLAVVSAYVVRQYGMFGSVMCFMVVGAVQALTLYLIYRAALKNS